MRVIALIGAGLGFLAALLIVLALTETRHLLGTKQFGVPWISRGGQVFFAAPWLILLIFEVVSIPFGYAIGDRIERPADLAPAAIGASIGLAAGWLLGMSGAEKKGVAGENVRILLMYAGAVAGAVLALEIVRRHRRGRTRIV